MRRKTLVNNLMSSFSLTREDATQCLERIGLDQQVRAEAVSIEQFARIADALCSLE